jgi:hypothetical protein
MGLLAVRARPETPDVLNEEECAMTLLALALLIMFVVPSVMSWKRGLVMCVIMGIAQDPMRKLAPDQPLFYVLLVGAVFATAWIRAALDKVPLTPSAIQGWRRYLKAPFAIFVMLVLLQAALSFGRYGSFTMTGIGLLIWMAPIPAVMLAYQYAIRGGLAAVRQWMGVYVFFALLSLSGVYFQYAGYDWPVLGEIGAGQIIYDVGLALKAYSGFYRASEIAAWHAAAIACFGFVLAIGKKATVLRVVFTIAFIALIVSLGILTGRRKMLLEIAVFISTYMFLFAWMQQGMAKLAMTLLAMLVVGYVLIVGFVAPDLVQHSYSKSMTLENSSGIAGYAVRGQSVLADVPDRFRAMGVQPIISAVETYGWLGAGLGTGSQGTSEIVRNLNLDRWMSEGGLGKITMELGVPGLLVALWLAIALARHLRMHLIAATKSSPQHARMAYGLLAFLVANVATFSIATQAFSDLFILLIIGWCIGFLLAMPVLALRASTAGRQRSRGAEPSAMRFPNARPPRFVHRRAL